MSAFTKPNLTTEDLSKFLSEILTKEQKEEYNELMKRYDGTPIEVDMRKVETECCVKCSKAVPEEYLLGKKSDWWVECSCSAHPGWYCDSHSPGNECFDDEECDCCNPAEDEEEEKTYKCSDCDAWVKPTESCCGEEEDDEEFYEVSCAENPDVEYFNTLEEAKAFCDKHGDLDYGLIMLCDKHKKHIGDWGDYEE